MFLGHVGIALGAKSLVPRISLGTLLAGALFIDLLWPILLLLGLTKIKTSSGTAETSALHLTNFSYNQSLLAVIFWAFLFAGVYYLVRRCPREAWICALVVASNWVLDLVTLHPDLKLVPGVTIRAGFSITEYLPAVLAVELTIFTIGIGLYCYYTKAIRSPGKKRFLEYHGSSSSSFTCRVTGILSATPLSCRLLRTISMALGYLGLLDRKAQKPAMAL